MIKLLIIEEEPICLQKIEGYFSKAGYYCEQASDWQQASLKIEMHQYNLIIFSGAIQKGYLNTIVQKIKSTNPHTGLIVLCDEDSHADKINCLNGGADDCIHKPFDMEELQARVKAVSRRLTFHGDDTIVFDNFYINPSLKQLAYKDSTIKLTKTEYLLLLYFVTNKNKIVSKVNIAEYVWGDNYSDADNFDVIYVHLNNLRKKLMRANGKDYIGTVWGLGYKFVC